MASRMKKTQIVADQIPIAVDGFELDGEAARIACGFRRFLAADHSGEADEHGRLDPGLCQHLRTRVLGRGLLADFSVRFEIAMSTGAAGMHDAFGNALAIEMRDLFDELIILERRRAALADGAQTLVVGDWMTLTSRQCSLFAMGKLLG